MSEPQSPKQPPSDKQVIVFIVMLSFISALILSILASALKEPQDIAKELDRSEQMLIAAKIYTHSGYFLTRNEKGEYVPAKHIGNGVLVPSEEHVSATKKDIIEIYKRRLAPKLVDDKGTMVTFEKTGIKLDEYVAQHKKTGYYKQPLKLIYEILPNPQQGKEAKDEKPIGYVIPVNGYGLWGAIYGYIALETDGVTVIGISWYEHIETPGLGANIAEPSWQSYFPGKKIFQPSASGEVDVRSAPVGIAVVKGKVAEVLGDIPKAKSAVDGMPGATLTGNGVTDAYREVLSAYRPFFIKIHNEVPK